MLRALAKKGKWSSIGMISLFLACINAVSLQNAWIGAILLLGFLLATSLLFGSRLTPGQDKLIQAGIGLGTTVAIIAIGGSLIYYLGSVHMWILLLLCFGTLLLATALAKPEQSEEEPWTGSPAIWIGLIGIVLCVAAWISAITSVEITQSVRSLWLVLSPNTILVIGLAVAIFIPLSTHLPSRSRATILSVFLLSILGVTAEVYSLGYGFDPFIHRTTIAHIAEYGTITPKPLYYIGQYALELTAHTLFSIPLFSADTWLVPILAAILLSTSAVFGLGRVTPSRGWASLCLLLLPFAAFIPTTPQALAYVFTGSLIFLSLPILARHDDAPAKPLLLLLAAAALITHPLAGIPACLYTLCVLVTASRQSAGIRVGTLTLLSLISAVSIPTIFLIQASLSGLPISFSLSNLSWDQLTLSGFWRNQFSSIYDGLYLIIDNQLWIYLLLALAGAWMIRKTQSTRLQLPLLMVAIWIINYLILSLTLEFDFLIEYERSNYAERLITISLLFLLPHIGLAIDHIYTYLKTRPSSLRFGFTSLLTILVVAGVYSAVPRHDNYARSAGFNVSATDFDAASTVASLAGDNEYIVLANQAASAAALELYGFKTYYHGDVFYYPIPTGGELYHHFLTMADEDPSYESMESAMDLAGVDLGFFVLHDYWWNANRIAELAKQEADSWISVGDGQQQVFIFTFSRR